MPLTTVSKTTLPVRTRVHTFDTELATQAWELIRDGANNNPPDVLTDGETYDTVELARKEGQRISRLARKVAPDGTELTVRAYETAKDSGKFAWSIELRPAKPEKGKKQAK